MGDLVIGYLFLGGTGAGAAIWLAILDLVQFSRVRRRSRASSTIREQLWMPEQFFQLGWALSAIFLGAGILCLLIDLGRPDRLLNILASPAMTSLTVGAYALFFSFALSAAAFISFIFDGIEPKRSIRILLALVAIVVQLTTITYTGVLFSSLPSVIFWMNASLPLLFAVSSLSCGIGLLFFVISFVETRFPFFDSIIWLARADSFFIIIETILLAVMLATTVQIPGSQLSARALISGELSIPFWAAVVVLGLMVPLIMERFIDYANFRSQVLWIGLFLLAGGLVLRFLIVEAGSFDAALLLIDDNQLTAPFGLFDEAR